MMLQNSNHSQPIPGPYEKLKAPEKSLGLCSMDFHSDINLFLTPVFLIHGELRGVQRAERAHFTFNQVPSHLAHINLPSSFTRGGGGGRPSWTKGNRATICHRPCMASGTLEGGQLKRAASKQGQLRREGVCIQAVVLGPDCKQTSSIMGQVTI